MSFFEILYALLIGPIQLIYEVIFTIANQIIGHPGLTIIVLSLMMNLLVLPLYRRADAMQEESRDIEAKLHKGVAHIKKTFSGDERMMILQTYYRQNNYKPTNALNGSVSLLLEIPFFIAAYQFLSHLPLLAGVSLGPIADLGSPDALITIGGLSINLLPILMTTINVISGALYAKGFPLKTRIQLYGMALIFLVFLYNSPAGLVFYWTLNNVFSLVKTLFYKLKNPRKVLNILCVAVGLLFFGWCLLSLGAHPKRAIFAAIVGGLCLLPQIISTLKAKDRLPKAAELAAPNKKLFILSTLFLTVLIGALIPSTIIADSTAEFIDINHFYHPAWYIVNALCLAAGSFLVWFRVFYWIAAPKGKVFFEKAVWCLCGAALINYMFFGTNLGVLSATLQFDGGLSFTTVKELANLVLIAAIIAVMWFLARRWQKVLPFALVVGIVALAGMSTLNITSVCRTAADFRGYEQTEEMPQFNLSKDGQNVIVLMLDRAMGIYLPYIINEKPELKEEFDGFTYYSNTLSMGGYTNFATPSLFGGYEYTPVELNKNDTVLLEDKHNEALRVMPVLFDENGFEVTVCDPPYAGYDWIPDLSIYDDHPDINTYITEGRFGNEEAKEFIIKTTKHNFFCFSVMKAMPLCLQEVIYDEGNYNSADAAYSLSQQTRSSIHQAQGLSNTFMERYGILDNMAEMTKISESGNTFLMFSSTLTHEPMLLEEPSYEPSYQVDNTVYDTENADRFNINGSAIRMETEDQMIHYQTNMAAMLKLGEWFNYLRQEGVYDNTRIIIVADHGFGGNHRDEFRLADGTDAERYFPLLLVKDFNATGFYFDHTFMTNADVPTLAVADVIASPKNPFTGKAINNNEKTAHEQYVFLSTQWNTDQNNGYTFIPANWYSVKDDIWDQRNWRYINEWLPVPTELQ